MNRVIKFRAWDKTTDILVDWGHIKNCLDGSLGWSELGNEDAFVLQQYTGLKDKNGKEIYEGDIVRVISHGGEGVIEFYEDYDKEDGHYQLRWLGWCIVEAAKEMEVDKKDVRPTCYHLSCEDNREIIGNIYENPELLEKT